MRQPPPSSFVESLSELHAKATPKPPWVVAGGNRIISPTVHQNGFPGTLKRIGETFLGMSGHDNQEALDNAAYLVFLANHAEAILALVKAAETTSHWIGVSDADVYGGEQIAAREAAYHDFFVALEALND